MTVLKGITPTPAQVAAAYREAFSEAIDQAGGKDGRISRNEAAKVAERADAGQLVSDNLVNWLEATGQKSVSANKFKGVVAAYAERMAAREAGPNQRLSLLEIRNLPDDLTPDLLHLRGKDDLAPVAPDAPSVIFDEGHIYELMYYRPEGPWEPERVVDEGTVRHDGTRPVVEGLNDVGDWQGAAEKALAYMWERSLVYAARNGVAELPRQGSVQMGPIVDEETGEQGLLVHWKDIDDASFAFFATRDGNGEWQLDKPVFLN